MAATGYEYDAFISYHISDLPLAGRVVSTIERAGMSAWWDKGERNDAALGTVGGVLLHLMPPMAVQCRFLVLLSSTLALASDWVIVEASTFIGGKRPTVMWHPREDAEAIARLRATRPGPTYDKVVELLRSPHIVAKFDRPRSEVDFVAQNIVQMLRLFKFVEDKGLVVSMETVQLEFPNYLREDMAFLTRFLNPGT